MDITTKKQNDCLQLGKDVVLVANRKELKEARAVIALAAEPDRGLLEGPVDGVMDIELANKKDHLHFRRGGLDQVTGKILAKDGKAYVASIEHIRKAKNQAQYIGRVLHNIAVARKAKVPIVLIGGSDAPISRQDREAFFIGIGVPHEVVHASRKAFTEWVKRAKHRASEKYLAEGIRRA